MSNDTLELEVVKPKQLQTRETFPAVKDTTLGTLQVADELGFAYLDGDIDFGAIGRNEIFQNIKYIILTEYFSVPLDREFGFDYSMIDKPIPIAEAVLTQEVAVKIALYEPRAQFREISFAEDYLAGKLSPTVKVVLVTTDELPSSIPPGSAAIATVAGAPGVVIEETDLPAFYEMLIETARTPGPMGPAGPKGNAATIEVGATTTGDPGTDAEVTNIGNEYDAIFDFVIPKGEKGDQGTGVNIKGTVPNSGALPSTGNTPGDMWIASDTGHGWTWDGDSWNDVGPIQGPVGPPGPTGPQGIQGDTGLAGPSNILTVSGTTTSAAGTNANVVIAGASPSQSLAFTIPRGDVGAAGVPGPAGQIWRGEYDPLATYQPNDAVEHEGSSYICKATTLGNAPVPDTSSYIIPPLANTAQRGAIAKLASSGQTGLWARGDNSWQALTKADVGLSDAVTLTGTQDLSNKTFNVDGISYRAGGVLLANGTNVTSGSGSEPTVWSINFPANFFARNGDGLRLTGEIRLDSGSAITRGGRLKWNGNLIRDISGSQATQLHIWFQLQMLRLASASQRWMGSRTYDTSGSYAETIQTALDFSSAGTLSFTVYQAAAGAQATHFMSTLEFLPVL